MELGRLAGVGGAMLLVGVLVGRSFVTSRIDFPEPSEARSAEQMERRVSEALADPRAFPRASALVRLFEGLSTENVRGVTRAFDAHTGPGDPVDLQLFLSAWVLLDPLAAVTEVQSWPDRARREIGMKIAVREWAASGDRLAATAFVETIADPGLRNVMSGPLVRGWALAGEREGALVLARRLWSQEDRVDVVDGLVRGVLEVEGAAAAVQLARQGDPVSGELFDQRLARVTINLVADKDPVQAAAYFEELAGEQLPDWLGGVLDRLAWRWRTIHEPADALEWLLGLPDWPQRREVLTLTAAEWAQQDLDAAWVWFGTHAQIEGQGALASSDSAILSGLLRRTARIRPRQAAEWVMRVREEDDRDALLRGVAFHLAARDGAAAAAWIDGLGLPRTVAVRLREAAARGMDRRAQAEVGSDDMQESR